ncbi:hypothetical protein BBO99_00005173 [Phytophthora kernoviae]|nr:hypothetical protein G195_005992 [Phytophthora kernoviae 00238/432]KAG2526163.1 hypothetical protein JM18_004317 [Phytophthora kernoviae]RLN21072.1 hypothetical protein BBI17_005435 [Phytophthora kernoviae]RLN79572.1 hypothetical protein BBO99_00005173 [Phytophthora kernoviae]
MLDQLVSVLQEQQGLLPFSQRGGTGPDDPDYPVHVPLATSAQICRAIKQNSATFSSSGRDMILCAIVDLVDFESFRNVYQKFDVHGKACFLHNLSIIESMDLLQCVVDELPRAGEALFRLYLATCSGNVGELPDNKRPEQIVPKDNFFFKLLSPDMEFFFVSDLAAYLTEAQWQLLSKEFEKNEKERKARKKPQTSVNTEAEFDIEIVEDEIDGNATALTSAPASIDRFEMIMMNYLRHHNLSSAQLLQLVANTFLSMLDEKEFSELMDKCWSRFPLDGQWSKASPEIQKALQALLEQRSEAQVLELLHDELEENVADEVKPEVPVAKHIPDTPPTAVSLTGRLKRKLTAVTAVAEPMEWQEYVKVGCLDVGCQTNFESEQHSIGAPNVSVVANVTASNRANHRISTAPAKTIPLTLATLLGKNNINVGTTGGKSKKDKYQKVNSTSVPRAISGLITSWRMNTEQLTQFAKKSLATVLKIIADAYSEMLTANRRKAQQQQLSYATPRGSGRTLTLSQIVYQSFLHSYGLPSIADMHLLAFSCALEAYRLQHLRVEYFARFCFDEVAKSELTNYLEFLEYVVSDDLSVCMLGTSVPVNTPSSAHGGGNMLNSISNSRTMSQHSPLPTPSVASKRIRHVPRVNVPDKENWQISLERAQEIAQLCFRDMRKTAVAAFCENLANIAVQGNSTAVLQVPAVPPVPADAPSGELLLNVDHLLQLAVTEWKREQSRRERHLLDAFRAGDVNGDGQLTSAEFTQIVLSIDASRDLGDILLMYSDTLRRTECEQLSPEVFLQVAREHELDRVVWQGDGELFGVVNEVIDMDATWMHVRGFFVGTLESLARDLPPGHFLRVCEGAGCGCLKCLLDGYFVCSLKAPMTMSDVGAKPRKAMDPDRLRKLMDSPSIGNANREVPTAILNRQTQVTSWNGEQCDTRTFSKLAPTARVILAKDLRACTVGEGTNTPLVPSGLQITDVIVRKERHSTNNILANYPAEAPRIRGELFKSNLLSHDGTGATSRREYQSKKSSANPSLQHHGRLFNETPLERNQQRAQNLRNESTAGRPFDIVNGGRVEYFPPTIPEKQHLRQAHPSVVIHPYTR